MAPCDDCKRMNLLVDSHTCDDPYTHEVHNDYASHSVSCNVCQEEVHIHRHFTWDTYPY